MLCTGEQTIWAGQILESLDDTTTPTGYVVSWLQNNLYRLNLALNTEFSLSGSCIIPEMSSAISGIYTEQFYCFYFTKQSNKLLGANSFQWIEIIGEDQGKIRRASPVDVSKTYITLAKDCKENLKKLTEWYNGNQATLCSQILYGERFGGSNFDLLPPPEFYCENNFIWNK